MNRRDFLKTITATAVSALIPGCGENLTQLRQKSTDDKPNFIIIFTDDQGYQDLGCFGSELIKTPNIDRMAKEGMKFTDFYATAPICTPSRASLLTGCYPARVGLTKVIFPTDTYGLNPSEITIAGLLKTRGYATACIGKWHLGEPPAFSPLRHGFDYFFGLPFSNDDDRPGYGASFPRLMRNDKVIEAPTDRSLLTGRCTDETIKFIKKNKDKPFFVYLAHPMPHVKLAVPPKFEGKSRQGLYGDTIEQIDDGTGAILDTLKQLDLDEKTLVIFASDNGPWLQYGKDGGSAVPLRGGKFSTFEGGLRVPAVCRWPGKIPAGSTCGQIATIMDLLPTLAKFAGTEIPKDHIIDGKDIRPLMSGQKEAKSSHEAFYYYWLDDLEAVRSGRWKLHLPRKEKHLWRFKGQPENQLQPVPLQLYDLETDVGEKNNVADENPEVVKRLSRLAREFDRNLKANARPAGKFTPEIKNH